MKKRMMIILAAVFVLFCTAGNLAAQNQRWFITGREGGAKAANNTVSIDTNREDRYVYIMFDEGVPGAEFDKIRLTFNTSVPMNIYWQAVYAPGQVWGPYRGNPPATYDYMEMTGGTIETDMAQFTITWTDLSREPFNKAAITGVCLRVRASARGTFTLSNVEFVGLR